MPVCRVPRTCLCLAESHCMACGGGMGSCWVCSKCWNLSQAWLQGWLCELALGLMLCSVSGSREA